MGEGDLRKSVFHGSFFSSGIHIFRCQEKPVANLKLFSSNLFFSSAWMGARWGLLGAGGLPSTGGCLVGGC